MEITITVVYADDEKEITIDAPTFEIAFEKLNMIEKVVVARVEDDKKSDLVDSLTPEQEEKLKEVHASDYSGTDDDMPDAFEGWLEDLTYEELHKII